MRCSHALLPIVGCSFTAVLAAHTKATGNRRVAVPGAYLVEFEDSHDTNTFYGDLSHTDIQVSASLNLSYSLFHGASFKLNDRTNEDEAVKSITAMAAVKQLWPLRLHTLPKTEKASAPRSPVVASSSATLRKRDASSASAGDTWAPHVMTQVDQLRALGYTGEGVKVAIIDTGVDYTHPALGGGFGEGYLVAYGYDLVGDDYDGSNTPVPDPDPLDQCQGHGTHVAGIIAAQPNEYNFTGAAPGVTLGMYRVFGCFDSVADDVLIAAYNMAYEAGSDIITASIGGADGWSEEPWAVAVQRIVAAGVPCPVAAGNDGDYGLFFASGAADGKGVTSVASFDSWEYPAYLYEASASLLAANGSNSSAAAAFGWTEGSPAFGNVSLPLWATSNDTATEEDACEPLPADTPDLSGYIVLIRRGTCTFVAKATNAAAYGARYVMFYANTGAVVSTDISSVSQILGVGMISEEQGAEWVEDLNAGEQVYLTITDPAYAVQTLEQNTNDVTGGFASTFTSWGPTWELDVYPLVAGVGGNIFSTYLTNEGSYAVLSGTSMATPLVAAIYALVGQVRGTFDPNTLRDLLTTTSKANLWNDGSTTYTALAPVPQQGPGLVQAYDAAFATTLVTPASLSFNDTDHLVTSTSFAIANTGAETVTYTIGHVPALTVYTLETDDLWPLYFPNPTDPAAATLAFSASTIAVPARTTANITVTPSPPAGLDASLLPVYSGYITVNGTDASSFAVPYLGVVGSMSGATNLDPDYTYLYAYTDADYTPSSAHHTFTVPYPTLAEAVSPSGNISYPAVLYQLDLGSALVRVDVVPLAGNYTGNTTAVLGSAIAGSVYGYPAEWLTRSDYLAVFTGLLADGSVVPAGAYELVVRALRIFGDREAVEGYESIETVAFDLVYV